MVEKGGCAGLASKGGKGARERPGASSSYSKGLVLGGVQQAFGTHPPRPLGWGVWHLEGLAHLGPTTLSRCQPVVGARDPS